MKVVLISTFDTFFDRIILLKEYFESRNDEVITITSDFSHRTKSNVDPSLADILIETKEYHKNLSFQRLYSHYDFSKKTKAQVEKIKPDIIYAIVPCNSIVKEMALYKKRHKNVKLYVDLCDLWPESMPIHNFKGWFPFTLWKQCRDKYINYADKIFTECKLFQKALHQEKNDKYMNLYWSRKEKDLNTKPMIKEDRLEFCYLGSINHIIDMDLIVAFLVECMHYKPTTLHIIGNGENKEYFIEKCLTAGINVIDHKEIYSQKEKQAIFDLCNYGLNVMKPTVVVGLTMKSTDYMCAGLPMINTITGDTKELCENHNIGFNIHLGNLSNIAKIVSDMSLEEQMVQRDNIKTIYKKYFTKESFFSTLEKAGL